MDYKLYVNGRLFQINKGDTVIKKGIITLGGIEYTFDNGEQISDTIEADLLAYVQNLMDSTPSYTPAWNQEGFKDRWHYIDGVFIHSLFDLEQETGDSTYGEFAKRYNDFYLTDDGQFYQPKAKSTSKAYTVTELDSVCNSRNLFDMYKMADTDDEKTKYLNAINYTLKNLNSITMTSNNVNYSHKNSYLNQIWCDGFYMYGPFAARYALATQDNIDNNKLDTSITFGYDEGKNIYEDLYVQIITAIQALYNENTGLLVHACDVSKSIFWADSTTGQCPSGCLRTMGWLIAGVIDVLDYFPNGTQKTAIISYLKMLIDNLYNNYYSSEIGGFYHVPELGKQSLTVPAKYMSGTGRGSTDTVISNYFESSGNSLIAYSMMKAAKFGYIDSKYITIGANIFKSVYNANFDISTNSLNNICISVGMTGSSSSNTHKDGTQYYYLAEKVGANDAKGTGPFIMAFTQYADYMRTVYEVNYVSADGSIVTDFSQKYTSGSSLNLPVIFASSDEAVQFFSDEAYTTFIADGTAVNGNMTIYVKTKAPSYYTINVYNESTLISTQTVLEGNVGEKPQDPYKAGGWIFNGWHIDSATGTAYDFSTPVTQNLNIYAGFDRGARNVGYVNSSYGSVTRTGYVYDGQLVMEVINSRVTSLEDSTHTFKGWYYDSAYTNPVGEQDVISGGLNVYAKWIDTPAVLADRIYFSAFTQEGAEVGAGVTRDVASENGYYTATAYGGRFRSKSGTCDGLALKMSYYVGGAISANNRNVTFTLPAESTVTVWFQSSGSSARGIKILDESGSTVFTSLTSVNLASDSTTLPAGTYRVGSAASGLYIFMIKIE